MPSHTIAQNLQRLQTARTNIASAITTKGGTVASGAGFEDFSTAIGTIPSGGSATLITKNIDANGTYNASSDSADGYSSVTVAVPNTYSAGDEGKVVSNGALVAQTARPDTITTNGTYSTTNYNSVTVNVPTGGGSGLDTTRMKPKFTASSGRWNNTSVSNYKFSADRVWTDGNDIYRNLEVLNPANNSWGSITWTGITALSGADVWTDGTNIYYSAYNYHYVLDVANRAWSAKSWTNTPNFYGSSVWTDGINTYVTNGSVDYVLDTANDTWVTKTWTGLSNISGGNVWTDGTNIYYSQASSQWADGAQKVLDTTTSTWSDKTWTGITNFGGINVWTDGVDIFYSSGAGGGGASGHYVLNKATGEWTAKTWDFTNFNGADVWISFNGELHISTSSLSAVYIKPNDHIHQ